MRGTMRVAAGLWVGVCLVLGGASRAQDESARDPWSNDTELSLVATQGNSDTLTFGLKNIYRRNWLRSHMQVKFEGTQSDKADDPFVVLDLTQGPIDPNNPCGTPGVCATNTPSPDDNIERYLLEGRYDHDIGEHRFWNAGASWDRNLTDGSGIESRYIAFVGLGNTWYDTDELQFRTNYGLSYTDREETTPDPEKDDTFAGFRFDWSYLNKFGKSTTYRNSLTINYNLSDGDDYNFDMINSISVSMTERVALKVSLQLLFNNFPPLRDVDLDCANPNPLDPRTTVPCDLLCVDGTGNLIDCTTPGATRLPDEVDIRKEKSDYIFNTSLVIKL